MMFIYKSTIYTEVYPQPTKTSTDLMKFHENNSVLCQGHHVSFNFNKLRAMVAARVLVGIQLDRRPRP